MKSPLTLILILFLLIHESHAKPNQKPNILLITADDMNWDSLGCTGNSLPGYSSMLSI